MTGHLSVVREAIGRHDGRVAKTLGDGVMAIFDTSSHARRAAVAIQQGTERAARTDPTPLHVRIGLNCGEIIATDEGGEDMFGWSPAPVGAVSDVGGWRRIRVYLAGLLLVIRSLGCDLSSLTCEPG